MNWNVKILISMVVVGIFFQIAPVGRKCLATEIDRKVISLTQTAKIYAKQGQYTLSIKLFGDAIRLQPGNLSLYYERAHSWGDAGNYLNAVKDFSFVISREGQHKRFSHAERFRADCYVAVGAFQKAVNDYNVFLRRAPKDGKVWSYLTEAYALMGRNDLALQAIKRGIAANSHWTPRLRGLEIQIMKGEKITPHRPLSN